MRRLYICSAVIDVVALGIAGAASAGEYKNADALSVAQGKPKRTDCSIKEDVDTKTYYFGDEASQVRVHEGRQGQRCEGRHLLAALQGGNCRVYALRLVRPETIDGPRAARLSGGFHFCSIVKSGGSGTGLEPATFGVTGHVFRQSNKSSHFGAAGKGSGARP